MTIAGDLDLTANFTRIGYTLTLPGNPTDGGSVLLGNETTPSATYSFLANDEATFSATPAEGYQFTGWSGACAEIQEPVCTVTIAGDLDLTANFTQIGYTLTLPGNPTDGGSVYLGEESTPAASYSFLANDEATFTATPAEGYQFTGWTGACAEIQEPVCTVAIAGDLDLTANFTQIGYTLTLPGNPTDGGSVLLGNETTPSATHSFLANDEATFTATPAEGYQFTGWTGACAEIQEPVCTVTIAGDLDLTANFTRIGYTLTLPGNPTDGGSVYLGEESTPAASYSFLANDEATFTATPAEGLPVHRLVRGLCRNPRAGMYCDHCRGPGLNRQL